MNAARGPGWCWLALLVVGCGGDPEPAPAVAAQPADTTAAQTGPPQPKTRDVVVVRSRFPKAIMELQPGDVVDVRLTRGGRARGRVEALKPEQLALASEGTSVITRLTPEEVAEVRLLHRPPPLVFDVSEQPRDERESWLPRFAGGVALQSVPEDLWKGRYGGNTPLTLTKPVELATWEVTGRMGQRTLLTAAKSAHLEPLDQLKLVAGLAAAERKGQAAGADLGTAQVWLHRRGAVVTRLLTTVGLPVEALDPESLRRLQAQEPSTFIAMHPGTPPEVLKLARAPARDIQGWQARLTAIPDRAGVRRLRAQRSPDLPAVEAELRRVYQQMGAASALELGRPLVVELVLPGVQEGQLRLGSWSRELGLD